MCIVRCLHVGSTLLGDLAVEQHLRLPLLKLLDGAAQPLNLPPRAERCAGQRERRPDPRVEEEGRDDEAALVVHQMSACTTARKI
jgi:hypothetical protein